MPENMSISADETKHQRETAPKALDMNKETSEDDQVGLTRKEVLVK